MVMIGNHPVVEQTKNVTKCFCRQWRMFLFADQWRVVSNRLQGCCASSSHTLFLIGTFFKGSDKLMFFILETWREIHNQQTIPILTHAASFSNFWERYPWNNSLQTIFQLLRIQFSGLTNGSPTRLFEIVVCLLDGSFQFKVNFYSTWFFKPCCIVVYKKIGAELWKNTKSLITQRMEQWKENLGFHSYWKWITSDVDCLLTIASSTECMAWTPLLSK